MIHPACETCGNPIKGRFCENCGARTPHWTPDDVPPARHQTRRTDQLVRDVNSIKLLLIASLSWSVTATTLSWWLYSTAV